MYVQAHPVDRQINCTVYTLCSVPSAFLYCLPDISKFATLHSHPLTSSCFPQPKDLPLETQPFLRCPPIPLLPLELIRGGGIGQLGHFMCLTIDAPHTSALLPRLTSANSCLLFFLSTLKKMTGETPEVRSDKRRRKRKREEREETSWSIMEHHGTSWNIVEHHVTS